MANKLLIVANWKMNPASQKEAKKLFDSVKRGITRNLIPFRQGLRTDKARSHAEVVICPPFIYLPTLKGLTFGGQNVHYKEKGAFTGEISPLMLKDLNVKYVILGHSERRKYFGETDEIINKKVKISLECGLNVVLCIGETLKEKEKGETENILRKQIDAALEGISILKFKNKLNIAYEPVWAISSGDPYKTRELPNIENVEKIYFYIKTLLAKKYNQANTKNIRIIYGGSTHSGNVKGYLKETRMQGLLVGGASLNPKEFIKIVKSAQ